MPGRRPRFVVGHRVGDAAELHGAEPTEGIDPTATWFEVTRPALVLGSAQPLGHVDAAACARGGVEIVRRRSGGGAVLLVPGEMMWLDVVILAGDPLWHDDIGRSMWWLGEVWVEALERCGVTGAEVHRGGVRDTTWSRHVCFAGLGAGEVTIDGTKAVGISQRRTRSWARLQSSMHLAWRGDVMAELMVAPSSEMDTKLVAPAVLTVDGERFRSAVEAALLVV